MTMTADAAIQNQSGLRLLDSGVIYRNPLPGHQAVSATHPFICALSENELLASYKVGQGQYAKDNMIHLSRSMDGGKTWKHEGPFRDRARDSRHYQYSTGNLTLLRNGTLIMNNWRCDRSDPERLYIDPITGGRLPLELAVFSSHDGGRTWSDPAIGQAPPPKPGLIHGWNGAVVELDNGEWMQPVEPWLANASTRKNEVRTYVMFSSDQGRTWREETDIGNGMADGIGYSHVHIAREPDGRFIAYYWTMNQAQTEFYDLSVNRSTDLSARHWTTPVTIGVPGQTCHPVILDERRTALIYSHRVGSQPGIKVALSCDGGRTWDLDGHVVVWDAYGIESLGVPPTDKYPGSHDAIAYGAPHLARVDDNTLIASFWCTQSADTHVRFARIQVER